MEQPFVFVHITDIHLQRRSAESSYSYFRHFVKDILPVIQPSLVVNTGDITQSQQLDLKENLEHDEWVLYSSVLKEFGWFNQSKWLDVRGNHDAFVHYPEPHPYKLHMVYGVAGKSSVYSHTVTTSSGKLRFIGIDANGPLFRHFNGFITREMLDALEHLFQSESYDAHLPSFPSLPTILFTHYPLFTMDLRARSSQNHSLKDLIKQHKPRFYLCGHMHSALGGMITRQFDTIEAELFDFKIAHQFRLYSYFRGELSFMTYNLNIDDKPIILIHSPTDHRFQQNSRNDGNRLVFFTIYNTKNPKIALQIDGRDYSASAQQAMEMGSAGIDVYFEPELAEGLHEIRGTITNEFQKTTRFQRVFAVSNSLCAGFAVISRIVHSMGVSSSSTSSSSSGVSFKSLSHVELGELESSSVTAGFALEYPTSSGVSLVMKTDWSSLMLYLNPLICLIILFFFWGFHRLALWLLQRQAAVHLADAPVFASSAFFASDRKLKLALLEKALSGAPWAVRWALSRVLLVCSDEWIAFGAIASLLCRCFLPRFYRDEKGDLCVFVVSGFGDLRTGEFWRYMDSYVFGAAFYYAMLVLFVVYLLLFAAPSTAKSLPFTLASYLLLSVDVWMFWKFFEWGLRHRQRRYLRSLGSLLLQLNDSVSFVLLFALMVREKCLVSSV